MDTQQKTSVSEVPYWERVTKRMRSGKHLGRRYCQSHHVPHKPLYRPPAPRPPKWEPKVKVYVNPFTVEMPDDEGGFTGCECGHDPPCHACVASIQKYGCGCSKCSEVSA